MKRKIASHIGRKSAFKWRSHEPSRLETFSDAVFAFAVTLIIVSLEVPKTFNELFEIFKGFMSFAACFAILFMIWNNQNIFFRRYGLNDPYTTLLNGALLFVVLLYVYPLKFLFVAIFSSGVYLDHGHAITMITDEQTPMLMYVYHFGFIAIYLLFSLMYLHAKRQREEMELTAAELFETDSLIWINFLNVCLGFAGVLLVFLLPLKFKGTSGMVYFLIPFIYWIFFTVRSKSEALQFGKIVEETR